MTKRGPNPARFAPAWPCGSDHDHVPARAGGGCGEKLANGLDPFAGARRATVSVRGSIQAGKAPPAEGRGEPAVRRSRAREPIEHPAAVRLKLVRVKNPAIRNGSGQRELRGPTAESRFEATMAQVRWTTHLRGRCAGT